MEDVNVAVAAVQRRVASLHFIDHGRLGVLKFATVIGSWTLNPQLLEPGTISGANSSKAP